MAISVLISSGYKSVVKAEPRWIDCTYAQTSGTILLTANAAAAADAQATEHLKTEPVELKYCVEMMLAISPIRGNQRSCEHDQ